RGRRVRARAPRFRRNVPTDRPRGSDSSSSPRRCASKPRAIAPQPCRRGTTLLVSAPSSVKIQGRILYVTEDASLLEKQLGGEDVLYDEARDEPALVGNISTDELTPGWVCYYFDETLAHFCLVGLRGGKVTKDAIKSGGFGVIVSGISKGCGSSRET